MELNLGVDTKMLLLFTAEDEVFSLKDLKQLQSRARDWLDGFCKSNNVDSGSAMLLQAVLNRYLSDYADTRIREDLGDFASEDLDKRYSRLSQWHIRTAVEILGGDLGTKFELELSQKSDEWGLLH